MILSVIDLSFVYVNNPFFVTLYLLLICTILSLRLSFFAFGDVLFMCALIWWGNKWDCRIILRMTSLSNLENDIKMRLCNKIIQCYYSRVKRDWKYFDEMLISNAGHWVTLRVLNWPELPWILPLYRCHPGLATLTLQLLVGQAIQLKVDQLGRIRNQDCPVGPYIMAEFKF